MFYYILESLHIIINLNALFSYMHVQVGQLESSKLRKMDLLVVDIRQPDQGMKEEELSKRFADKKVSLTH